MTIYQNEQKRFYHIGRGAELIFVKDRDVVGVWSDMLPFPTTSGMEIYRDEGENFSQYYTSEEITINADERVLLWARMAGDEITGGIRWVPYITENNINAKTIKPLREVISPRVAYDQNSNTLALWFWTNVNESYEGDVYDEQELYPTLTQGFQGVQSSCGGSNGKRVLCYAIGQFFHVYIKGGLVSGYASGIQGFQGPQGSFDTRWDIVPVFSRPRIMNWSSGSESGLVFDGTPPAKDYVLVKITDVPANGIYPVDIYANGQYESPTGQGDVEILNLNLSEQIPIGTKLIAHYENLTCTPIGSQST